MATVAGDGSLEEEDLGWLLQSAYTFLTTIRPGTDSDDDDGDIHRSFKKDALLPSEAESARPPIRRSSSPLVPVSGLSWRPENLAEPVLFVTPNHKGPLALVSFIGYQDQSRRRKRQLSADLNASFLSGLRALAPNKTQSYAHMLNLSDWDSRSDSEGDPSADDLGLRHRHTSSSTTSSDLFTESESAQSVAASTASTASSTAPYDPYFLDDPELRTGKHKTVIALPGYLGSIGHFTRAIDLKKELNDQFRQIHPSIDPSLSLSKIRNLKQTLVKIVEQENLELSTAAKAFVFLERMILKDLVNKANRKLVAAACLLLATKANDAKDVDHSVLLSLIAEHLETNAHDLTCAEFPVFAALEFDLFPQQHEYLPHLDRILTSLDYSNIQEYLGERMYTIWKKDV